MKKCIKTVIDICGVLSIWSIIALSIEDPGWIKKAIKEGKES